MFLSLENIPRVSLTSDTTGWSLHFHSLRQVFFSINIIYFYFYLFFEKKKKNTQKPWNKAQKIKQALPFSIIRFMLQVIVLFSLQHCHLAAWRV